MDSMEFRTVDPRSGKDDLLPLLDMVGDARVVGLGECTHGASEIHRMKHRIVELLAEELGFSAVVLEANLAETIRVNEYTLEGRGDPAALLARHLYWGVSTEEVADLLRWMWEFNTSGRHRVALAGCDMQRIDTAAEIVEDHLGRFDLELAAEVADRYEQVLEADRAHWLSGMGIQAWFPVEQARGRRLRFSGYVRTEDVTDHACVWGWAGGARGTLAHDALEGRRPRGTTDWRQYAIDLDVPEKAIHVSLGCYLAGNGRAWFDRLAVEVDGEPWRDPRKIDLDLETEELTGFWVDPRNRVVLDDEVTREGRPTLRIEPTEEVPAFGTSDVEAVALAKEVLEELRERLTPDQPAKILRCARSIVQALEMRAGGGDAARARAMAENVEWLLDRNPGTRVVFWAHNSHVARGGGDTGSFLAQSLGADYLPVGFAVGEGERLAMAPRWREGLRPHPMAEPPEDSVERLLLDTAGPRLILDLRTLEPSDPLWNWFHERRPFRSVGAKALSREFFDQRLAEDFDLLCWIDRVTAARAIPRKH
jgi:erythromycin esterase-like protein